MIKVMFKQFVYALSYVNTLNILSDPVALERICNVIDNFFIK